MRILILGAFGMLGHKLLQILQRSEDAWGTVRGNAPFQRPDLWDSDRILGGVDARDFDSVIHAMSLVRPEAVVNCIGVIKQLPAAKDPLTAIPVNSLFPHKLANVCRACGTRLIHVSTDCVYSGKHGGYRESSAADATDLYGRTKYLGEVSGDHCLTLRTSIVGRELASRNGLVEWFLSQKAKRVAGYRRAVFSGLTTLELSRVIQSVLRDHPELSGLYHVSAEAISKYDFLCLLRSAFSRDTEIVPSDDPVIDRSLDSERFREAADYTPPAWPDMVQAMANDTTDYRDRLEDSRTTCG